MHDRPADARVLYEEDGRLRVRLTTTDGRELLGTLSFTPADKDAAFRFADWARRTDPIRPDYWTEA